MLSGYTNLKDMMTLPPIPTAYYLPCFSVNLDLFRKRADEDLPGLKKNED
jgi:hypothetical protein